MCLQTIVPPITQYMLPKKVVPDHRQCFDMVYAYVINDYGVLYVNVNVYVINSAICLSFNLLCMYRWSVR